MEPVTHVLMGAVLGRAGFNRKAAYATAAMAVAAELPDIDVVWSAGGPVVGFEHHRGITHTFLAVPVEAALVVGVCWAWRRWRQKETKAPWSSGWLYVGVVVALLSHLLLDWTNNYGVRPLFPFDPRWFAGSFVFIVEPLLYVLLGGALVMPWLFGLVGAEVGARGARFKGRGVGVRRAGGSDGAVRSAVECGACEGAAAGGGECAGGELSVRCESAAVRSRLRGLW